MTAQMVVALIVAFFLPAHSAHCSYIFLPCPRPYTPSGYPESNQGCLSCFFVSWHHYLSKTIVAMANISTLFCVDPSLRSFPYHVMTFDAFCDLEWPLAHPFINSFSSFQAYVNG